MDECPLPGIGPRIRMIVNHVWEEIPAEPMLEDHIPDSQQERGPVLVECEERHDDEIMEMHLDVPARQMDEQG